MKIKIFINLLTPFKADDTIDYDKTKIMIDRLIEQGCNNFVIGGNTGEGATLSFLELKHFLRYFCFHYPQINIYTVINDLSTKKVIRKINNLSDLQNLNGYIIKIPEISGLKQQEIYKHFNFIALTTDKKIIIKDCQKVKINDKIILKLVEEHKNIAGILCKYHPIEYNGSFNVFYDETLLEDFYHQPISGVISNLANLNYQNIKKLITSSNKIDHEYLMLLLKYFYQENITGTLKYALSQSEGEKYVMRLPLSDISTELKNNINKLLKMTII